MKTFIQEAKEMAKQVLDGIACVVLLIFFCCVVILLLFTAYGHYSHGQWVRGTVDLAADFLFAVITLTFARRKGWY